MTFGQIIKALREEKRLRQEEVCAALNVEQSTLSNWEGDRRKPKLEIVMKLADFFDVSVDYLLGREPEKSRVGVVGSAFYFYFPDEAPPLMAVADQRGITMKELSDKTMISVEHLENCYDKYTPTYQELSVLATALDTSTDYLLGRVREIDPPTTQEKALLRYYRYMTEIDRHLLLGKAAELVKKETIGPTDDPAAPDKMAK